MSTSVLPQLLEVDSELSVQASDLELQLIELQEKRKGIQTVIAMFESGVAPQLADIAVITGTENRTSKRLAPKVAPKAPKIAKLAKAANAKSTRTVAKVTAKKAPEKAAKEEAKAPKSKSATKVKATRGRPAKVSTKVTAKVTAKATKAVTLKKQPMTGANRSGRTANWQRYVQDSYSKAPLPDVIVGVLQAQPSNIFKIADVMSAVFKEDMPKSHFLKARNRVSNILSAGARDGDWFRGRGGTYSVSEKAIKAVG
jgi:hypothetical protein